MAGPKLEKELLVSYRGDAQSLLQRNTSAKTAETLFWGISRLKIGVNSPSLRDLAHSESVPKVRRLIVATKATDEKDYCRFDEESNHASWS